MKDRRRLKGDLQDWIIEERRKRERRRELRTPINVWVEEKNGNARYFHYSTNISTGGIFLEKKLPLAENSMVSLEFKLPGNEEPISVRGTIVRSIDQRATRELQGMCVNFTEIKEQDKEKIKKYIKKG